MHSCFFMEKFEYCKNCTLDSHQRPKTNEDVVFSMNNIKTQYYNELLLSRFIVMFGYKPRTSKKQTQD